MAWISIVVPVEAPPPEGVPPGSSLGGAGTPGTPLGDTAGPGWGVAADTGMLSAGVEVGWLFSQLPRRISNSPATSPRGLPVGERT